jgi:RimJ/RimL family protein N-acetyltransferase
VTLSNEVLEGKIFLIVEIHPIILEGKTVRLEPLSESHVLDLCQVGFDPNIWHWMLYGEIDNKEKMLAFIRQLLQWQEAGTDLPFAVIHINERRAIGCTRFMEIDHKNRSLEIGGTWYGTAFQRTAVNTECKYLLLKQAFEVYRCIRVQLKTDLNNIRSQKAIERIGAIKEGVLRNHMIRPDGIIRHTVYYSILDSEWSDIKARLEKMLA